MNSSASTLSLEACIEQCLECHRICLHTAMTHCLSAGGRHTEPEHFRLMMNCAEICRTSAHFMLTGSDLHHLTCKVCAEVCRRCAGSCEEIGEMEDCAAVCRRCAETCDEMSS